MIRDFLRGKALFLTGTMVVWVGFMVLSGRAIGQSVTIAAHNTDVVTALDGWNGTLPTGYTRAGANYVGTTASTSGGVYAIASSGFGYQPSGTAPATTCTLTGQYINNTGSTITSITITYDAFNIVSRASRTPGWAVTSSLGSVSALTWTYNASASNGTPDVKTVTLTGLSVGNGSTFTIVWNSDRGSGSGSSPLIGLRNVKVKSNVAVSAPTVTTGTATSIGTTGATLNGTVNGNGSTTTANFDWGTSASYGTSPTATTPASGAVPASPATSVSVSLSGLSSNTLYNFRAAASGGLGGAAQGSNATFTTLSNAPGIGTGSSPTNSSFVANWTAPSNTGSAAYTYTLQVSTSSSDFSSPVYSASSLGLTNATVSSLSSGTTYYYRVRADNAGGASAWSSVSTGTATTAGSSKCPSGNTLATATTSYCQAATASAITATAATSGASGTPTIQYQWYYNATNSNTVSGATSIAGANASTYAPGTAIGDVGTKYYFCVAYATDNGCSQTSTAQALASTVTVGIAVSPTGPPADQATSLTFPSLATTSIGGSFAASTSNPTGYLVVRTTTGASAPSPVNGTTYTVGATALGGYIETFGNTSTFTSTGLSSNTSYTYWAYAYNSNGCTSGPQYNTVSPLSGTATTTNPTISASTATFTGFSYVSGYGPSTSQTFNLSASNLSPASGNLTVTGSTNFEVSTDNSTFSASATVAYGASTLSSTPVYVRLKSGLAKNSYNSETISISGGSAATLGLACSGTVTAATSSSLLAAWDVSAQTGYGPSPMAPTTYNNNLTVVGLTRGAGVTTTNTAAARAWGGNYWGGTDKTTGASGGYYGQFSLTPKAGYTLGLNSLTDLNYRRSGTGPASGQLQYSTDGTNYTDIGSALSYSSTSTSGAALYSSASPLSLVTTATGIPTVAPGSTLYLRIVNYGGASGGTWYVFDVANSTAPDLSVYGYAVPIVIDIQPTTSAQAVCLTSSNNVLSVSATATTGTIGYQWYRNTTASYIGATAVSGATSAGFSPTVASALAYYFCALTSSDGGTIYSNLSGSLTITAPPNAGTLSGTQAICSNGTTIFSSNGDAGGAWASATASVATINATSGAITPASAGSSLITYTVTGAGGCANASATRTVTVTTAPNAGTLSGTQAICSNGTTTFSSNGDAGGAWTSASTSVATVNATSGAITPASAGSSLITYTVTGTGGCANATATRTVTVNALPTATIASANSPICTGGSASFDLNGTPNAVVTYNIDGGSTTTITLDGSGNGTLALPNTTVAKTLNLVSVANPSTTCSATLSATATITVDAASNAGTIAGANTVCSGTNTSTLTISGQNGSIQWQSSTNNVSFSNIAGSTTTSYAASGLNATTYYRAAVVNGACPVVYGASARILVNQRPATATLTTANATVCPNSTVNLNVNISGGQSPYQLSFNNLSIIGYSSNANIPIVTSTGTTTYTLQSVTDANGCQAVTVSGTTVITSAAYLWTGSVSTSWNATANWSCGIVPDVSANVQIPALTTSGRMPIIPTDANLNNLELNGSLTLGFGQLVINGAMTGTGSFKGTANSTLYLNGSGSATVYFDQSGNNAKLNTLVVAGSGTVTLGNPLALTNLLSVTNGTLITGNNLTLKSTSLANSAIVGPVSGHISGKVTIERFVPHGYRAYRDMAVPIYNAGSFFDNWQEGGSYAPGYGIFITGGTGANGPTNTIDANGLDRTQNAIKSLWYYRNVGWTNVANTKTTQINPFQGYRVLIRGDRSFNLFTDPVGQSGAGNYLMMNPTTLRATGELLYGNVVYNTTNITVSGNGITDNANPLNGSTDSNYTMVTNPYQCALDWNNIVSSGRNTGLSANYWYLDPTIGASGSYVAYNAFSEVSTKGGTWSAWNRYIQPGQAFYVKNSNSTSPVLTITEADKSINATKTAVFGTQVAKRSKLGIVLSKKTDSEAEKPMDMATLVFSNDFQNGFGPEDAGKMRNASHNLSIQEAGRSLSIDGRKMPMAGETIPLTTENLDAGEYRLTVDADGWEALEAYLVDKPNGNKLKLQGPSATLDFKVENGIGPKDRFAISFVSKPTLSAIAEPTQVPIGIAAKNGQVIVSGATLGSGASVMVYNLLGQLVASKKTNASNVVLDMQECKGVFVVKVIGKAIDKETKIVLE